MILENKHHLCLCAAAFVFGILLSQKPEKIWIFLCMLLSVVCVFTLKQCKKKKEALAVGCLLAAFAFFAFFLSERQEHQYHIIIGRLESGTYVQVQGTVCRKEIKSNNYLYYLKKTSYIVDDQIYNGGRILLYADDDRMPVGAVIRAAGTAEKFSHASNEGNFDAADYYRLQNITFQVFSDEITLQDHPKMILGEWLYQFQKRMVRVFTGELSERDAGVLCRLVAGSRSQLDHDTKQMYQDAGISHILAISGLHISILGFGIYRLMRKCRCSYLFSAIFSSMIVLGFAIMSGFGVSAKRALIMYLFIMGAQVFGRTYACANALAAASLVILIQNPLSLFQSGFLFSFTALVSISISSAFFEENISQKQQEHKKIKENIKKRMAVSVAIQLWMMPLTAWFYYEVPVYALFLNLLVIPLCSWLLGFGILGGIAGLVFPVFSKWLLVVCHLILEFYEYAIKMTGFLPCSSLITGKPPIGMLLCYYLLLTGISLVLLLQRWNGQTDKGKRLYQIWLFKKERWRVLGMGIILSALILCLLFPQKRQMRIDFLDVGQGDGICIADKAGHHIFIDGGSTSEKNVGIYRILPFLKYHQIRMIDAWIVTHGDEDHISGLIEILNDGYPVRYLVLAEAMPEDEQKKLLVSAAEEAGTEIIFVCAGDALKMKGFTMECIFPAEWETGEDANSLSQVWLLQEGDFSVLFTGDIGEAQEKLLLERKKLQDVTLLKAAHHGSKNSSSESFLEAIEPDVTVISCGEHNVYGHPHAETLERLDAVGSEIFCTMECGQITLFMDKKEIWYVHYPCAKEE